MTGPYVPPEPPPPSATPPAKATPWGKIALFGCLGLLVIGLVITGIGVAIYMMNDRETVEVESDTGITTTEPATTTTPGTVTTAPSGSLSGAYEVRTGNLGPGDAMAQDGSWYDAYPMSYPMGTTVTATLRSSDFDAYLTILSPSGSAYSDDDTGGGTDSRVTVTIDEGGTWNAWANTLRAGDTGGYTLTVETSP